MVSSSPRATETIWGRRGIPPRQEMSLKPLNFQDGPQARCFKEGFPPEGLSGRERRGGSPSYWASGSCVVLDLSLLQAHQYIPTSASVRPCRPAHCCPVVTGEADVPRLLTDPTFYPSLPDGLPLGLRGCTLSFLRLSPEPVPGPVSSRLLAEFSSVRWLWSLASLSACHSEPLSAH